VEPQRHCHIHHSRSRSRSRRRHLYRRRIAAYRIRVRKSISIFIITHFTVSHSFPVTWTTLTIHPEKKMVLPCHCVLYTLPLAYLLAVQWSTPSMRALTHASRAAW
jgi:hypothetical protein